MSDAINLLLKVGSLESGEQFDGYSKVIITVSDDVEYASGTDSGRTLTLVCPWGTQKMADDILARVRGYQYQPYSTTNAQLDPSAELGDGLTVGNVYGGIFSKKVSLGPMYTADISAPGEEQIDYTAPYKSPLERKVTRENKALKSELKIQAGLISAEVSERKSDVDSIKGELKVQANEISAKVSQTGGDNSSFGWALKADSWRIFSGSNTVLKADKNGLEVKGVIRATSGEIGGFSIQSNYLSYNGQTWGGTNTVGAYIGQSGIQLGKNFKVDMQGNLTASGGTFGGTIKCDSLQLKLSDGSYKTVSPDTVNTGISGGNSYSRSGWNNYNPAKTWSGAKYGLNYGDATDRNSGKYPTYFQSRILCCDTLLRNNRTLSSKVATINGEIVTLAVWK